MDEGEAIREEISTLYLQISQYPGKPSEHQLEQTTILARRMKDVRQRFSNIIADTGKLNDLLGSAQITWQTWDQYKSP